MNQPSELLHADPVPAIKRFSFSYFMTMALVVSFFPLYFESQGYTKLQIGTLYSLGPLAGIFANLFWGLLSDRFQTIKKLLLICLLGQFALIALAMNIDAYALLVPVMLFFFFFQTPVNPLTDSLSLLTIRGRNVNYANIRVYGSIGFAFSAILFNVILGITGYEWTVVFALITVAISIGCVLFVQERKGGHKPMEFAGLLSVLRNKELLLFLAFILLMAISHRINDGFLSVYLGDMDANYVVGWAWMVSALSEIPMFFFLSKHGHKYKELPLLAIAGLCYAVRFLLVAVITHPVGIVATQALHSVTFGIFLFTGIRYISQVLPDEYRSTGQALFAVTWTGMSGLISGLLGGYIYDAYSGRVMYMVAAAIALVAAVCFYALHMRKERTL